MTGGAGVSPEFLSPDWPAPPAVAATVSTRRGGVSRGAYAGFNLADHVDDDAHAVAANRRRLIEALALPRPPVWLRQCHGTRVVHLGGDESEAPQADAAWTDLPGVVCAVLTADCLPVLLCDRAGTRVAAVHAGWRGLAAGVLEAAVAALGGVDPLAWLGPAIGPEAFVIGDEVRARLRAGPAAPDGAFRPAGPGRWYADLYALARARLAAAGVTAVYGGGACTVGDAARFYSYRRDGATGRMASLIWIRASGRRPGAARGGKQVAGPAASGP